MESAGCDSRRGWPRYAPCQPCRIDDGRVARRSHAPCLSSSAPLAEQPWPPLGNRTTQWHIAQQHCADCVARSSTPISHDLCGKSRAEAEGQEPEDDSAAKNSRRRQPCNRVRLVFHARSLRSWLSACNEQRGVTSTRRAGSADVWMTCPLQRRPGCGVMHRARGEPPIVLAARAFPAAADA